MKQNQQCKKMTQKWPIWKPVRGPRWSRFRVHGYATFWGHGCWRSNRRFVDPAVTQGAPFCRKKRLTKKGPELTLYKGSNVVPKPTVQQTDCPAYMPDSLTLSLLLYVSPSVLSFSVSTSLYLDLFEASLSCLLPILNLHLRIAILELCQSVWIWFSRMILQSSNRPNTRAGTATYPWLWSIPFQNRMQRERWSRAGERHSSTRASSPSRNIRSEKPGCIWTSY